MAQVKKLQQGGSFRMNGREISGQEALDKLTPLLGGTTGGISTAIQQGKIVDYNPADNTIFITDDSGEDLTLKYLPAVEGMSPRDSKFRRNLRATFNTERHQAAVDLTRLRNVDMIGAAAQDAPVDLTELRRGSGWFAYHTNEDGTKTYIKDHQGNADKLSILDLIANYYNEASDDDRKNKYNTNKWTKSQLDEFGNYYKTVQDKNAYWQGLKNRIESGDLSEADIYTLKSFGFDPDDVDNSGSGNTNKISIHKDWMGDREAAENEGIGIVKNTDGSWSITGNNPYTTDTWYARGLNFLAGTPFENGAIYNGRLYTQEDVFSGKYKDLTTAMTPFITAWRDQDADWNTRWNNALASNVKWYGMDRNIYANAGDPTKGYAKYWTRYFTDNDMTGNYNLIDATNAFSNAGDRQIVSYVDGTNRNIYGIDEPIYLVRNADGTITKYDNYNALLSGAGLTPNSDIYGFDHKDIQIQPYQNIKGKEYAEYQRFGKNGQENTILVGRDGRLYLKKGEDAAPKRIYDIEKLKTILAGADFENKDLDALTVTSRDFWNNPVEVFRRRGEQRRKNTAQKKFEEENPTVGRFQWGGPIQKVQSKAVSNDPTTQKSDYIKSHAWDGSDGGLTDNEWMQIGAAVGDLVGVGVSFVPIYGNVVGAATGAAASTTKFKADLFDGYQAKDLRQYLGNLVLDAATLVPVIGTGAKAVKAAKAIKAVGKPLIKLLSITGATAPVVTAVTKIANGEKYTSEDLATAIRGLGAGIIATKSIKDSVGNAKLARDIKAKSLEGFDPNAKITAKVKNYDASSTPEEIKAFIRDNKTKEQAIQGIIGDAKSKNIELSKEEAESILKQLGIKTEKGKLAANPLKWRKASTRRGESTVSFETPVAEEAHSALRYYISPRLRAQVLGSEAVYGFGKQPGIVSENVTKEAINQAIKAEKPTLAQQALMRMTAENPQAFGDLFKTSNGKYRPTQMRGRARFGGGYYYRPTKMDYETPGYKPFIQFPEVSMIDNIQNIGKIPYIKPITNSIDIPNITMIDNVGLVGMPSVPALNNISGFRLPSTFRPFYAPNGNATLVRGSLFGTPTGIRFNKQGGKIVKAQGGFRTQPISYGKYDKDYMLPEFGKKISDVDTNRFIYDPNFKGFDLEVNKSVDMTTSYTPKTDYTTIYAGDFTPVDFTKISLGSKVVEDANKKKSTNYNRIPHANDPGEGFKPNLPNIDDTIRAAVTARYIAHDTDLQRAALGELYKRQFQTPYYDYARYNYGDIQQGRNEAFKPYLDSRFVTSDPIQSMSFNLTKAKEISALNGQYNAQISQRKNQIDDINRQIGNQNEAARIQTANEKSQYITGLNYQNKMLDSMKLNRLWSDVIAPYGQQMSQQGRDAWNQLQDSNYQAAVAKAKQDYTTNINSIAEVSKLKSEYAVSEEAKKGISFEDWMELDATRVGRYKKAVAGTKYAEEYQEALRNAAEARSRQLGAGWGLKSLWMKSGGTVNIKTTNKNQRSVPEQIAINSAKSAKRSVDELSKALFKMLQQLTK